MPAVRPTAARMTCLQSRCRSYTFGGVPGRGLDAGLKAGSISATSKSRRDMIKHSHALFPIAAVVLAAGVALIGADGVVAMPLGGVLFYGIAGIVLIGTVFAAVHYAETIAYVVGEPFGTLVVTIAVTVIEVSLIASIMLGGDGNAALARDTVFSVIMIVCNGLVGLCLLLGGLRYREQTFSEQGASAYLSVLVVLAGITLVLPNYTITAPGPIFSGAQLAFVSVMTVALYLVFLFIQTVHHRDYFVQQGAGHGGKAAQAPADGAGP
jgi:Ca2+:H+ antiporter